MEQIFGVYFFKILSGIDCKKNKGFNNIFLFNCNWVYINSVNLPKFFTFQFKFEIKR